LWLLSIWTFVAFLNYLLRGRTKSSAYLRSSCGAQALAYYIGFFGKRFSFYRQYKLVPNAMTGNVWVFHTTTIILLLLLLLLCVCFCTTAHTHWNFWRSASSTRVSYAKIDANRLHSLSSERDHYWSNRNLSDQCEDLSLSFRCSLLTKYYSSERNFFCLAAFFILMLLFVRIPTEEHLLRTLILIVSSNM